VLGLEAPGDSVCVLDALLAEPKARRGETAPSGACGPRPGAAVAGCRGVATLSAAAPRPRSHASARPSLPPALPPLPRPRAGPRPPAPPQPARRKLTVQERVDAAKGQGEAPRTDLLTGLRAAPSGPTNSTGWAIRKARSPAGRRAPHGGRRPPPPRRLDPRATPAPGRDGEGRPPGRPRPRARRPAPHDGRGAAAPPRPRAAPTRRPQERRRAEKKADKERARRAAKDAEPAGLVGWAVGAAEAAVGAVVDTVGGFLGAAPRYKMVAQPYRPEGPLEQALLAGALRSAWRDRAPIKRLLQRLRGCGPCMRSGGGALRGASRRGAARRRYGGGCAGAGGGALALSLAAGACPRAPRGRYRAGPARGAAFPQPLPPTHAARRAPCFPRCLCLGTASPGWPHTSRKRCWPRRRATAPTRRPRRTSCAPRRGAAGPRRAPARWRACAGAGPRAWRARRRPRRASAAAAPPRAAGPWRPPVRASAGRAARPTEPPARRRAAPRRAPACPSHGRRALRRRCCWSSSAAPQTPSA
jgi:hypothetical protein